MPLPLLFIAIAAATGALGIGKSVKAAVDTSEAKDVNKQAGDTIDKAKKMLKAARDSSASRLKDLGSTKINVLNGSINHFVRSFSKLTNVDFQESTGLNEAYKLHLDKQDFKELKEMGLTAANILGGISGGALGGALTAFGAYSAAGVFASASTGTAIATLSGAAATNATLAFFGGGSLAAGGLGIAGGTMVLGGLVAGPALAVMGFIVGAKASKVKDEAYTNLAKAKEYAENMNLAGDVCSAIGKRCALFMELLEKLDTMFVPFIDGIDKAIRAKGTDYRCFSEEQQNAVVAAASLAKAIKTVLDTPILDKDGNMTYESGKVLENFSDRKIASLCLRQPGEKKQENGKVSRRQSREKKQENGNGLVNISDLIEECTTTKYKISNEFQDYDLIVKMDWEKLADCINHYFGMMTSKRGLIDYFIYDADEDGYVRMDVLVVAVKYMVIRFHLYKMIENCLREGITGTDPITEADVNWDKLIYMVKRFHGTDVEKWQFLSPSAKVKYIDMRKIIGTIAAKTHWDSNTCYDANTFDRMIKECVWKG